MYRVWFLQITLFAVYAESALPPGYDEEMWCPPRCCLRRKKSVSAGLVGPRSIFHECVCSQTGTFPDPKPWGTKLGDEMREKIVQEGWTQWKCGENPPRVQPRSHHSEEQLNTEPRLQARHFTGYDKAASVGAHTEHGTEKFTAPDNSVDLHAAAHHVDLRR